MDFTSQSLLEGIVAGVAAAVVIGVWKEAAKWIKDWRLERAVRQSVSSFGIGSGINGLSVTINNRTAETIRVRGLAIAAQGATFMLNAQKEIKNLWWDRKVKFGKTYLELSIGSVFRQSADEEYPDVPAFSQRDFTLHPSALARGAIHPNMVIGVVQFPLCDGGTRIICINSRGEINKLLAETAAHLERSIASGELDNARKMFNLPPVKP